MARTPIITAIGFATASFLVAAGLDFSPYENQNLAEALYALAVVCFLIGLTWWFYDRRLKRGRMPDNNPPQHSQFGDNVIHEANIEGTGNVQAAGDIRDSQVISAGDNSTINIGETSRHELPSWIRRPGCPVFLMSPGTDFPNSRVLCTFYLDTPSQPASVEAKWSGPGINMDWVTPMLENLDRGRPNRTGYQMKPINFNADSSDNVEMRFSVRFWLDDGEHGATWIWPMQLGVRHHWQFNHKKGSGTGQPHLDDTW